MTWINSLAVAAEMCPHRYSEIGLMTSNEMYCSISCSLNVDTAMKSLSEENTRRKRFSWIYESNFIPPVIGNHLS